MATLHNIIILTQEAKAAETLSTCLERILPLQSLFFLSSPYMPDRKKKSISR